MNPPRILIAGAGIGGLAAAAALKRSGFAVKLFERAPEILAVGAGLTLQPNAIAALRTIGLAEPVVAAGHRSGLARILRPDGKILTEIDIAGFWREEAGVTLHRATLQRLLAAPIDQEDLVLDAEVAGFGQLPEGVRLKLADGRQFEGDLLIGADGIRSAVRRQLLGDGEPLYAGYYCWRGVCSQLGGEARQSVLSETWGRGQRFGLVPIDGERIYWFVVLNGPPGGRDQPGRLQDRLRGLFEGWHEPIAKVIATTPEAAILRGDIIYRRPSPTWGQGRITLLGDAAHPMTPDLGQGACQAIEDAVVLAACLEDEKDPVAGLRRYEKLRQARTAGIVAKAARMGGIAQWQNPLICFLRDQLNRGVPQRQLENQVSQLWRFPGPAPRPR
jgi:2-polyprenyl-6-methoxyphenol hydroxylase-like FAD-dependent oxidoreductase